MFRLPPTWACTVGAVTVAPASVVSAPDCRFTVLPATTWVWRCTVSCEGDGDGGGGDRLSRLAAGHRHQAARSAPLLPGTAAAPSPLKRDGVGAPEPGCKGFAPGYYMPNGPPALVECAQAATKTIAIRRGRTRHGAQRRAGCWALVFGVVVPHMATNQQTPKRRGGGSPWGRTGHPRRWAKGAKRLAHRGWAGRATRDAARHAPG